MTNAFRGKCLVAEAALIELAEKFDQARALFDFIQDEVEFEERTCQLATIGLSLTADAARSAWKLTEQPAQGGEEVSHG